MTKQKKIQVVSESETGRNERFLVGKKTMSREKLVSSIENGNHPDYHVRNIDGVKTPASNPDSSKNNNLN